MCFLRIPNVITTHPKLNLVPVPYELNDIRGVEKVGNATMF